MRLVIDLQGAQTTGSRNRGIGRYSRAFTRSIIENANGHEVLIALNGGFPETIDPLREEFGDIVAQENFHIWRHCRSVCPQSPGHEERRQAAQVYREAFLSNLNPDIVHVTSLFEGLEDDAVVGIGSIPTRHSTAVTLYDLIPHIHREIYLSSPGSSAWYDQRLAELRRADLLLAISESSARESIDYLGFDPDRVVTAGTAADPQFQVRAISREREKQLRQRYGVKRPFVMYTGGIDHRKNIERLIESFGKLPVHLQRKHQLAIVCSAHEKEKRRLLKLASAAGLSAASVILTGYVPEDDLIDLYNLCQLFVFPSWHEGFGLPALEAMSCGAPTIASDRSSLPEVMGSPKALFDPFDTSSMAESIRAGLQDNGHREFLIENAAVQSSRCSWSDIGRRAIKSFEDHLAKRNRTSRAGALHRPRLAYCSPLPPSRSGIADVSKEILPHLSRYYRLDAVVHDDELPHVVDPLVRGHSEQVIGHTQFLQEANEYDRIVYNLGNSAFHLWMFDALKRAPGAAILHDFFLSAAIRHRYYVAGDVNGWPQCLFDEHGPTPLFRHGQPGQEPEVVLRNYPCNISILEDALGVIVHSNHAKELASQWLNRFEVERWRRAPLPREPLRTPSREEARGALGVGAEDFIVASFGMLNPFKHNDRLLQAFAKSRLAEDSCARLVFVGGASEEDESRLLVLASELGVRSKVTITGWTSAEDYALYLSAVDIAVQLRRDSRGETSAAVLDCLSQGIPTIVNANGAMAELPPETVVRLSDEFQDGELVRALDTLHSKHKIRASIAKEARAYVKAQHAPWAVAKRYNEAIEGIYGDPKSAVLARIQSLPSLCSADAVRFARLFAELSDAAKGGTLHLDISILVAHDAKSGIQRVVRNILSQLIKTADPLCRVELVYFDTGTARFVRAASFAARFFSETVTLATDPPVKFRPGDTYVALDLSHHHAACAQAILTEEQRRGVTVCYVVYDLLPIQFPDLFPDGVSDLHSRWLDIVAEADRAICISRTTADELIAELERRNQPKNRTLEVSWFHLGADIEEVVDEAAFDPTRDGLPDIDAVTTFLAVGTIEPRKGLRDILQAFEQLWSAGVDVRLILAGSIGWKMDAFVSSLRTHPEWKRRLFWFEGPSDRVLMHLYSVSDCLIAASLGEGFGLPVVEATLHGKPVIARDLPVFREVAPPGTIFFQGSGKQSLANSVRRWMSESDGRVPVDPSTVMSWRESASQFLEACSGRRPYKLIGKDVPIAIGRTVSPQQDETVPVE